MSERDDDFLSRWSRRKVEARDGGLQKKQPQPEHKPGRMRTDPPEPKVVEPVTETDPDGPTRQQASLASEQPPAQPMEISPQAGEAAVVEDSETPDWENFDFDSLNYASDFTQFMKEGVPEVVRRRALRTLWQSNPILANIDGLNDYDEDFTDAALVMKTFASDYKVGSGYLTEEERMASYSEEARTVGSDAPEEEAEKAEVADADELDVDDIDEDDGFDDATRFAADESESKSETRKSDPEDDTA